MTKDQKDWIDQANYYSLLERWRNAPVGDPMFQSDTGDYYSKIMASKRESLEPGEHVAASKHIGWER